MGDNMIDSFREYRKKMNDKLLAQDNKVIKRIFNLDTNTYKDGALTAKTKEMLGLGSSMFLRCYTSYTEGPGILGRAKK